MKLSAGGREIFKDLFCSPELIVIFVISLLKIFIPFYFIWLGNEIKHNLLILNTIFPVMGSLLYYSVVNGLKLLRPKDNNKVLYQWDLYWKLKFRVYISILFILISVFAFSVNYFFNNQYHADIVSLLFVLPVSVSVTTTIILFISAQKIIEVLETHT